MGCTPPVIISGLKINLNNMAPQPHDFGIPKLIDKDRTILFCGEFFFTRKYFGNPPCGNILLSYYQMHGKHNLQSFLQKIGDYFRDLFWICTPSCCLHHLADEEVDCPRLSSTVIGNCRFIFFENRGDSINN